MYLALDPGTHDAGAVPDGGTLARREHAAPTSTSSRSCPRSTSTRATTCCCCSPAARRRSTTPARPGAAPSPAAVRRPARDVQALRAAEPGHADVHEAARRSASANIQPLDPQPRSSSRKSLGGVDGQLTSLINSSNTNFSAISSQDANLEQALTLLPGDAPADDADARQGAGVRERRARPTLHGAAAVRARVRPRAAAPRGRCSATRRR